MDCLVTRTRGRGGKDKVAAVRYNTRETRAPRRPVRMWQTETKERRGSQRAREERARGKQTLVGINLVADFTLKLLWGQILLAVDSVNDL